MCALICRSPGKPGIDDGSCGGAGALPLFLWYHSPEQDRPESTMTQTSNRIFDEMARLMNDAAGVASGVRREFDTLVRTQIERVLREFNVVQREDFEAVKDMARLAREENEVLKARIEVLEGKVSDKPMKKSKAAPET